MLRRDRQKKDDRFLVKWVNGAGKTLSELRGQIKQKNLPSRVHTKNCWRIEATCCFYSTLIRFVPSDNIKDMKRLREKKKALSLSSIQHVSICLRSHFYLLRLDKATNDGKEELVTRLQRLDPDESALWWGYSFGLICAKIIQIHLQIRWQIL